MHKLLITLTILAFVSGILDLVLNVAILSKVSGKAPVAAIETMYKSPVTPTPTASLSATPSASVSATPAVKRLLLRSTVTPAVTKVLSPVPSHATLK